MKKLTKRQREKNKKIKLEKEAMDKAFSTLMQMNVHGFTLDKGSTFSTTDGVSVANVSAEKVYFWIHVKP